MMTDGPWGQDDASQPTRSMGNILEQLRHAGLEDDAASAYVHLLQTGSLSASSLAERLGWPRSKAYRVLEAMQHDGLVSATMERPILFQPAPPQELFRRLRDDRQAVMRRLEETSEELLPLLSQWHSTSEDRHSGASRFRILKGSRVVARTLLEILDEGRSEVLVLEGPNGVIGGTDVERRLKDMGADGVDVRIARVREDNATCPPFLVVDGDHVVAGLESGRTMLRNSPYLWSDASGLVAAFRILFDAAGRPPAE